MVVGGLRWRPDAPEQRPPSCWVEEAVAWLVEGWHRYEHLQSVDSRLAHHWLDRAREKLGDAEFARLVDEAEADIRRRQELLQFW